MVKIMIAQFLLVFRESLEALLLISIMLAYLNKTDNSNSKRYIWYGSGFALGTSVLSGIVIWILYGGLSSALQKLFEGGAALIAVVVLSTMIYWMATQGRKIQQDIHNKMDTLLMKGGQLALISFAFVAVFREGLETVLFLTPFVVVDLLSTLSGTILGVIGASLLVYLIYRTGLRINLHQFFYFTSILLILLAGGLAGYGVHELLEFFSTIGIDLGWISTPAFQLAIPVGHPLHHKGIIGSIFAVLFGYTVSPEWARLIVHISFIAIIFPLIIRIYNDPKIRERHLKTD